MLCVLVSTDLSYLASRKTQTTGDLIGWWCELIFFIWWLHATRTFNWFMAWTVLFLSCLTSWSFLWPRDFFCVGGVWLVFVWTGFFLLLLIKEINPILERIKLPPHFIYLFSGAGHDGEIKRKNASRPFYAPLCCLLAYPHFRCCGLRIRCQIQPVWPADRRNWRQNR